MEREGEIRNDDGTSPEHDVIQPALSGTQGTHVPYALRASPPLRSHITPRFLDGYYVLDSHDIGMDSPKSLHIVWVTLAHGAIADMPNWRTFTGQSRERACGDGWLDAVHPDDRKRVAHMWTRAVRERTPFQTMYRVRRRDATYIPYDARCVPVFRADGSVQEWVWSYIRCLPDQEDVAPGDADCSSVTQLRITQDLSPMRPDTLASFMSLFEAMADAVVVYDTTGRVHFLNAAARTLLDVAPSGDAAGAAAGFTIGDAGGQPFDANRSPVERIMRGSALATADAEQVTAVLPNGRTVRMSLTGTLLRDTAGMPAGAAIVLREIRDESQDAGGGHDALEALLALAEAVIFVSDEATDSQPVRTVIEVPRVTGERLAALACDVIGCTHAGILAVATLKETVHPIAVAGLDKAAERVWWEQFGRAPRLDTIFEPAVIERLRADQVVLVNLREPPYNQRPNPYGAVTLLAVPMLVGEQLIGILTLDYDGATHVYTLEEIALAEAVAKLVGLVIERERLLHDRAEAQASVLALREAKRRMDEFLSVASHELRTPLTVIKANLQLLTRRIRQAMETAPSTAPLMAKMRITPDFLDRTQRQVDRLDRLVNDLLDISRIEAGRLTLRTERVDLRVVVREAVEEQRSAWIDRTITLELPDTPVIVEADPERIGQVVTNYLINALKYSRGDQQVSVTGTSSGDSAIAHVAVRDRGPGLTAEQREHLWERFHRVSGIEVQSGSGVGLGLGLHLSKTIVERHGGEVGVESAVGEGSTFWFTLPLAERSSAAK